MKNAEIKTEVPSELTSEVVLFNLKSKKAFLSLSSQEARKVVDYIARKRAGKLVDEGEHRNSIMRLHERGLVSTKQLLDSFDLDYDKEAEMIRQEKEQNKEVIKAYQAQLIASGGGCFDKEKDILGQQIEGARERIEAKLDELLTVVNSLPKKQIVKPEENEGECNRSPGSNDSDSGITYKDDGDVIYHHKDGNQRNYFSDDFLEYQLTNMSKNDPASMWNLYNLFRHCCALKNDWANVTKFREKMAEYEPFIKKSNGTNGTGPG